MSDPTDQETLPATPSNDAEAGEKPARKRAAKKVAKKAAKKAAAKKTTTKTAKKAAKKTATIAAEEALPVASEEMTSDKERAPENGPAGAAGTPAEAARPDTAVDSQSDMRPAAGVETTSPPEPKPFGRVPGGGPVTPRENREQDERTRGHGGGTQASPQNQTRESRSKRRRENRKKRAQERTQERSQERSQERPQERSQERSQERPSGQRVQQSAEPRQVERQPQFSGEKTACNGMLELAPKGFGFLRVPEKGYEQARDDIFVTPETIRKFHLRVGQWIHGSYQSGPRGPQLVEVVTVNGLPPEETARLPHFDELKAINPDKRISFETTPERFTTRVLDIMAPVGRGQRGLIVSPPRSGKTTLLLHIAEAIRERYEDTLHLMVLLVDERPEEVTEFRRALPGAEIYASSNDEGARSHCRIAELAIERAKRLVEAGKDVFLLMDSITRLARAYNQNMGQRGRGTGSGGITIGALEIPRRLFAAARNTRGGGSLTILATALIQTNSRADEAIFMEFKGTGNMELVLDRKIAENYIYPAVDIFKSGTRREELLLPAHMLHKIHLIRRGLSGHRPVEAMERLIFFLKKFPNNPQMLLEIKG